MNKSKLKTDFICIATSGYTVDGRQITAKELHEMAETYDPEYYTANLWPEHRRYFNCGEVLEVKAEEQDNGEVKLFAIITPNQQLLDFNLAGQKLFTSVEIAQNFRNSGKAYLSGLGVTDSPASVGTTKLDFFNQENVQCGEFININFAEPKNEEEKMARGFFNALAKFFSSSAQTTEEPTNPNNNNKKEEKSMDEKQFAQLLDAVNGLSQKMDNHFSAEQETKPSPEPKAEEQKPEQTQSITAEQFNQLLTTVQNLDKKFNELSQEQTTVPSGVPEETQTFNVAV
ncbi:GPO family capsid scaffolding protein [Rodentibacter haemolyticus]|uniref:GPO family capsid scaffolding protein n=1 Tax=Rodentibacter haemolyticus TaxID=2778911 RepID=A0ABX6UY81_9PAST|nr:GPO family capsid scaffolding protein [Rodentibacter haemolyticus]QPB43060.1 GPO family capsid scaffolding protein [Rodentibacter haemolyticus]